MNRISTDSVFILLNPLNPIQRFLFSLRDPSCASWEKIVVCQIRMNSFFLYIQRSISQKTMITAQPLSSQE